MARGICPSQLPVVGQIECATNGDFFGDWSDLSGKRILCIGFSENEIDQYVARHAPAQIISLTYWDDHIDAAQGKHPIVMGDITRRTKFEDGEFDAVLTLSVLEHVSNISSALSEMQRIIRTGGEMLHMFGPAWSCAYGHHLYADPDDKNLNFVQWSMPAHMHLLCSQGDILNYYRTLGYEDGIGEMVWHWFHEAPHINRMNYDAYSDAISKFNLVRMEAMYNFLPEEHLELLRNRVKGCFDFSTYGGRYKIIL